MQYEYYAFISYSRKDEPIAKWLQEHTENYQLPSVIYKGNVAKGHKLSPIFRDKTDFTFGIIAQTIKEELFSSRYLIVICSPSSAVSDWVNKEVQIFIKANRVSDIIPVIVSGDEIGATPIEKCYPPALLDLPKEQRPQPICLFEEGRDHALVHLVSRMLNIDATELWSRYCRRRNLKRLWSAMGMFLVLSMFWLYYEYNRTSYEYYANYVERWGVPEGIVPLTKEQVAHRSHSYRFEYKRVPLYEGDSRKWRLVRMVNVNSAGYPIRDENIRYDVEYTFPIHEIEYQDGEPFIVHYKNEMGEDAAQRILTTRDDCRAALISRWYKNGTYSQLLAPENTPLSIRPRITYYVIKRNSLGYAEQKTFHLNNDRNERRSAIENSFDRLGYRYVLDNFNNVQEHRYILKDSSQINPTQVVGHRDKINYKTGSLESISFFNRDNKLALCGDGYASMQRNSDHYGNYTEIKYSGIDSLPCIAKNGYARIQMVYDDRGNRIFESYFGTDNRPCKNNEGYVQCKMFYDSRCRLIKEEYFDEEGNSIASNNGYAMRENEYDSDNRMTSVRYYNEDGKPTTDIRGVSCRMFEFDAFGNKIGIKNYDENGALVVPNDNQMGSENVLLYNEDGLPYSVQCLDTAGRPYMTKYGATWTIGYDDCNNETELSYYDESGKPFQSNCGFSKVRFTYDDFGIQTGVYFYGVDGKPSTYSKGYSSAKLVYNRDGFVSSLSYYDVKGFPCMTTAGYARCEMTTDSLDYNVLNCFYYDNQGNLVKQDQRKLIE